MQGSLAFPPFWGRAAHRIHEDSFAENLHAFLVPSFSTKGLRTSEN
jgi:hypothetical protein